MRIVVTGSQGQVVTALVERGSAANIEIVPIGRPAIDLSMDAPLEAVLAAARPDVVVSAAAYTAVDKAEDDREAAFAINSNGAGLIAEAAAALDIPVIHLSTDYVFSGSKLEPYLETDPTGPVSVYGKSKLGGEQRVAKATPNHVILRTAWVYSPFGANFLKTMLRLAENRDLVRVVADQKGTPTSALDIADAVIAIAARLRADKNEDLRGIFHLTGSGEATWADFAEEIFAGLKEKTGKVVDVERITTADYPTPAVRPANSTLSNTKLAQRYGLTLPDWRVSTKAVIDRLI